MSDDPSIVPHGRESFPASGPNSLASPWRRIAGRLIDSLILAVVVVPFAVPFVDTTDPSFTFPTWFVVLLIGVSGVYEVAFFALRGQTLAMMMLKVRAARFDDGHRPTWGQSAIRWLLPSAIAAVPVAFVSILSLLVYARMFWDPLRQGWQDKAAGMVIVRTA
ncbi:MAG: RDD family protein [Acidimicrobiales bacterium]|nr:RDD family protein [Acidimicrobiales bacterium]